MLQLVEKSGHSHDSLPNHTRAAFPSQALILIFLSLCWHAGQLDRSSWHHPLRRLSFWAIGSSQPKNLGSAWRRKTISKEELILMVYVASFRNTGTILHLPRDHLTM